MEENNGNPVFKAAMGNDSASGLKIHPGLRAIIGDEIELYFTGEIMVSMGKGAAAYSNYKKLLEKRKDYLYEQIIAALKIIGNNESNILLLEDAKKEIGIAKSLWIAKEAIPPELFLFNMNPLNMLYNVICEINPYKNNSEYLSMAESIITILTKISDKVAEIMSNKAETTDNNASTK